MFNAPIGPKFTGSRELFSLMLQKNPRYKNVTSTEVVSSQHVRFVSLDGAWHGPLPGE